MPKHKNLKPTFIIIDDPLLKKLDPMIAAERRAAETARQIALEAQLITQRLKPPVEEAVAVLSLGSPIYTNFVEKAITLEMIGNYLRDKLNFSEENNILNLC
jgi:hypothetical protein